MPTCNCNCCHGACCCGDNCSIKSCSECFTDGGAFLGPKTTCDEGCTEQYTPLGIQALSTEAEIVTGACCVEGECSITSKCECDALDGTWKGADTTCDPYPCECDENADCPDGEYCCGGACQAEACGGCCTGDECETLTAAECESAGGSYYGDGIFCGPPNCCPVPNACEECVDGVISYLCSESEYCCPEGCQAEPCPCESDGDCAEGQCCVGGACEPCGDCETDSDCNGYSCCDGACQAEPCTGRCCGCNTISDSYPVLVPLGSYFCTPPNDYISDSNAALEEIKAWLDANGYTNTYLVPIPDTVEMALNPCNCYRSNSGATSSEDCPDGWEYNEAAGTCYTTEAVDSCDDCTGNDSNDCGVNHPSGCGNCTYYDWAGNGDGGVGGDCVGSFDYDNPQSFDGAPGSGSATFYPCIQSSCADSGYASCSDGILEADCSAGEFTLGAICGDPFDCTTEPPP